MPDNFPKGCYVRFLTKQNKKGYWDVSFSTIQKISKEAVYNQKIDEAVKYEEAPVMVENIVPPPQTDQQKGAVLKIVVAEGHPPRTFLEVNATQTSRQTYLFALLAQLRLAEHSLCAKLEQEKSSFEMIDGGTNEQQKKD